MSVGKIPMSTVAQVIRHIQGSGLHIPDEEDFEKSLLCSCHRCVKNDRDPLNGHPICATTDGKQIFFYRKGCDLQEGHQPIHVEAGSELNRLITATFDESLVRSRARREAAACH